MLTNYATSFDNFNNEFRKELSPKKIKIDVNYRDRKTIFNYLASLVILLSFYVTTIYKCLQSSEFRFLSMMISEIISSNVSFDSFVFVLVVLSTYKE